MVQMLARSLAVVLLCTLFEAADTRRTSSINYVTVQCMINSACMTVMSVHAINKLLSPCSLHELMLNLKT